MTLNEDHIRELLDQATPGPWTVKEDDWGEIIIGNEEGHRMVWGDQLRLNFEAGDKRVDAPLVALAPELARDWLRMRNDLLDFRTILQDGATNPDLPPIYHLWCESTRDRIDRILNGETNA